MQRRLVQVKVYYKFCYSVWKETFHEPLNVAAAKKSFPSVYIIDRTCFDECFLFRKITGIHFFLYKFIVSYLEVWWNRHVVLFETSVLKEARILYSLSPQ